MKIWKDVTFSLNGSEHLCVTAHQPSNTVSLHIPGYYPEMEGMGFTIRFKASHASVIHQLLKELERIPMSLNEQQEFTEERKIKTWCDFTFELDGNEALQVNHLQITSSVGLRLPGSQSSDRIGFDIRFVSAHIHIIRQLLDHLEVEASRQLAS